MGEPHVVDSFALRGFGACFGHWVCPHPSQMRAAIFQHETRAVQWYEYAVGRHS